MKFDLEGKYLGEWPGWYNWPDEMVTHKTYRQIQSTYTPGQVVGPHGQLLVSALGAMDDQHRLAPGLLTYRC